MELIIPKILYILALLLLVMRIKSGAKKHFLYSVFSIVIASTIVYIQIPNTITLVFMLAIMMSFIGDLMMAEILKITSNRVINGAIAFGTAHIIYIYAYYKLRGSSIEYWSILLAIVFSVLFFAMIGYNSSLNRVKLIVNYIYSLLITSLLTGIISFSLIVILPVSVKIVSLLGIILFLISDGVLAYNEFKRPVKYAKEIIAITYVIAQILLQLTVLLIYELF